MGGQRAGVAQHRHAAHRVGRPRQPVVEDAQHMGFAAFQQPVDQALGIARGAHHHDVRGQAAGDPPAFDGHPPPDMGQVDAGEAQGQPQPGLGRARTAPAPPEAQPA